MSGMEWHTVSGHQLWCSFCLYVPPADEEERADRVERPITVINGQAVCDGHAGYVAGAGDHRRILNFIVGQSGFDSLAALQEARRQS